MLGIKDSNHMNLLLANFHSNISNLGYSIFYIQCLGNRFILSVYLLTFFINNYFLVWLPGKKIYHSPFSLLILLQKDTIEQIRQNTVPIKGIKKVKDQLSKIVFAKRNKCSFKFVTCFSKECIRFSISYLVLYIFLFCIILTFSKQLVYLQ